jgi:hypothetical protein
MMRKFVLTAAAMTAFAALSAPASAEMNYGPLKDGNKCFTTQIGGGKDGIGYWGACPQAASVTPAAKPKARRNAAR